MTLVYLYEIPLQVSTSYLLVQGEETSYYPYSCQMDAYLEDQLT